MNNLKKGFTGGNILLAKRVSKFTSFPLVLEANEIITLFDSQKCSDILEDQDLLLLRFLHDANGKSDLRQNSFILVTSHQISVFDPEKHELARISNMYIGSASILNT